MLKLICYVIHTSKLFFYEICISRLIFTFSGYVNKIAVLFKGQKKKVFDHTHKYSLIKLIIYIFYNF